jgi:cobalt-zinc-cadmium efflux system membrane fusion protein
VKPIPIARLLAPLAVLALALPACREEPSEPAAHQHAEAEPEQSHEPGAAEEPHGAEEEADVLEIAPDLLRDLRLTTAVAARRATEDRSLALGELHPDAGALSEVAAPIAGRIVSVLAAEGDRVKAGTPLIEMESVELGQARAALLAAQARSTLAAAAAQRVAGLQAERVTSSREREEAEAELAAARAEEQAARAGMAALGAGTPPGGAGGGGEINGRFTLSSPQDGVVLSRDAVPGRAVDANALLLRIADTSTLWLVVHVYERDALRVRLGGLASAQLAALPGAALEGRVTWIGQEVELPSRTLPVRVELPNPDGRLRPGLSGSARLPLDEVGASVVAVPSRALQRGESGWCVFVPRDEHRFERRAVGRGRDLGDDVEVVSGLEEGETVIVEGAFVLRAEAERRHGGGGHHDH